MLWENNHKAGGLAPIAIGDIVNLRYTSSFRYLVKVIVTEVATDGMKGKVEAVFDGDGQGEICAGDSAGLVGQTVGFSRENVYYVTKAPKL